LHLHPRLSIYIDTGL